VRDAAGPPIRGLMQDDFPLTLTHAYRRMRDCHPGAQVSTLTAHDTVRADFGEVCERADRLARVLEHLGVKPGDRVATFAWNNQRHFELYMAIPCTGAILHTLNIRLFAEQLTYIVDHAEDKIVFVDESLVPVLAALAPSLPGVRHWIVMEDLALSGPAGGARPGPSSDGHGSLAGEGAAAGASASAALGAVSSDAAAGRETDALPGALRYEDLLEEAGPGSYEYPQLDERQAASLCYTSGTTGNPKGVLYSHRSICLHATGMLMADNLGMSRRERALVVVPMFHVNAWGIPYAAALCGADLVLPDRFLQAEPLVKAIESERPTVMGCVPTIFADLLRYADSHEVDLSSLTNAVCGGSAVPRQLMKDFQERHNVCIHQGWGMTETSPVVTFSDPAVDPARGLDERYWDERALQGKPIPWTELRLIDDDGQEVPWDGQSTGEIEVRGPWIARAYYDDPEGDEKFDSGWLRTGDIAAVEENACVRITDRSKDVIKSGGEWISSVELENELMVHPDVLEAAVIAKPDERWAERPLCCVVLCEGADADADVLVEHLRPRVAKWWLPDEFAFVAEIPKTSVGKFDKKVLRAQLADGTLAGRMSVSGQGVSGQGKAGREA
jgi:fatty-acyl-CoA synthase